MGRAHQGAGGYGHLVDTYGRAPATVGVGSHESLELTVDQVFADLGASFLAKHGDATDLGDTTDGGVPLRPEHGEVRIFDHWDEDPTKLLESELGEACPAKRRRYPA